MKLFYTNDIIENAAILSEEETRHCMQVLRNKIGDEISFIDGNGSIYKGIISENKHKKAIIQITDKQTFVQKKNYSITIAIAPTKNHDRFDFFLEKSTEIGIDNIIPVICYHSERKSINIERCNKILISAIKQSKNLFLPKISEPIKFAELIKKEFTGQKFIGYCDVESPLLSSLYSKKENVLVLIGPEGDFDSSEYNEAIANQFSPISLGNNRLRTETAGLYACTAINILNW